MKYLALVTILILITFLESCSKSSSVVQEDSPSFSFASAVSEVQISGGKYISDFPVDSSHYITVPVDVHQTGPWSYQTDTVNGIRFKGVGTFTDTGRHSIKLIAEGTPKTGGAFSIVLTDEAASRTINVICAETYFDVHFKGINYAADYYPGSEYRCFTTADRDTIEGQPLFVPHYTMLRSLNTFTSPYFAVKKLEFFADPKPSLDAQADFFSPGHYDFWRYGAARTGFELTFGINFDSLHLSELIDNYEPAHQVEIVKMVQVNKPRDFSSDLYPPYFKMLIRFRCNVTSFYLDTGILEGEAVVAFAAIQ